MSDTKIMQIQVNGSGVDSGEIDYTIFTASLDKLFSASHSASRKANKDGIMFMLDELKQKTQEYYDGSLKTNPPKEYLK